MEKTMHLIKKYANRKMYDTTDKRYISRNQLSELIKRGEEVTIIDNRTGEDLTTAVVSQLIGMESTDQESDKAVSSKFLMQLLRKGGGTLTDYAKKYVSLWQGAFTLAEDEIDKLVNKLVKNKELSLAEGKRLKSEIKGYTNTLKGWISESIDKRVAEVIDATNLATSDHLKALSDKLDALEKKVDRLAKAQSEREKKPRKKTAATKKKARTPAK
jgi:polyhydroxyalkanoate synthesis repressor PhaR